VFQLHRGVLPRMLASVLLSIRLTDVNYLLKLLDRLRRDLQNVLRPQERNPPSSAW
jgi:hypothetical protein